MRIFKVLLIIFLIFFGFGICEIILRYTSTKVKTGWQWEDSPFRDYQNIVSNSEINQLGFRGKSIKYEDQDFVVLLVGDSQVESSTQKFDLMPESLLQQYFNEIFTKNVKVFSIGSSGWGQDQQFLALSRYFSMYRADLVLLWATPINDYWENTFPDRNMFKDAGPIKPTYYLKTEGELQGPFYKNDFFYKNFAILHQLSLFLYNDSINDLILKEWQNKRLPSSIKEDSYDYCIENPEVSQSVFFSNIFSIDHDVSYTVTTEEHVSGSRSHFSPMTVPKSKIDSYQIQITKKLFLEIEKLVSQNKARFNVFYTFRKDFDELTKSIKCVKNLNGKYLQYNSDYLSLLEQTINTDLLLILDVQGEDNIVVSKEDRHLGYFGNKKAMRLLAKEVGITFQ